MQRCRVENCRLHIHQGTSFASSGHQLEEKRFLAYELSSLAPPRCRSYRIEFVFTERGICCFPRNNEKQIPSTATPATNWRARFRGGRRDDSVWDGCVHRCIKQSKHEHDCTLFGYRNLSGKAVAL